MATRKEAAKIIDEFEEGFRKREGRKLKKKELIEIFGGSKEDRKQMEKLKKKALERAIRRK